MPDIKRLVTPIEGPDPCGPNLEYAPEFLALEILAAPRGERGVGDATREAQEPEWRDVARQALRLAETTRDLRVAIHLCAAWLKTEGIAGWLDGVALLRALLERHWDGVHPRLDSGDPAERVNALANLCADGGTLGYLRRIPLVSLERVGTVSLRDLRIASGALKPAQREAPIEAVTERVEHVLTQAGEKPLRMLTDVAETALAHLDAISAVFSMHAPGHEPDFTVLRRELCDGRDALRARFPARDRLRPEEETLSRPYAPPSTSAAIGDIGGPEDIRQHLDAICRWYERHEPSSPVAPLLQRARALVGMDFFTLLATLAPGGLAEFAHLAGMTEVNDTG